jgi:hypothetical protein
MGSRRNILKSWFYLRTGYTIYLAMFVGAINILTTSYFLSIKQIPQILAIFPNFVTYVIFLVLVSLPIITITGWLHFKRLGTYSAEAAIYQKVYPYNYKFEPGYNKEVFGPAYLAILRLNMKKINGEQLSEDEEKQIAELESLLEKLIDGGHVGNPPKGAL